MRSRLLLILMLSAGARSATAAVLDAQPGGFTVTETVSIAATPASVWRILIKPADWWSPDHTFSHDARNLTLDARAGGAWMEALPNGGSVRHMSVIYSAAPSELRLEGALRPMQTMGAMGHLTYTLKPEGEKTQVTLVYDLGGHAPGGLMDLAPVVDRVMSEQLARLKNAVETNAGPQ